MKKVFFQGAFDFVNAGHIKCFKKAKQNGDYFIMGLNTDEFYRRYKKKEPMTPYYQKKEILEAIRYIDKVVPCKQFNTLIYLKKYNIDVYVVAKEWIEQKQEEIKWIKAKGGKIVYTPRYKGIIHTSELKKRIISGKKKWGKI